MQAVAKLVSNVRGIAAVCGARTTLAYLWATTLALPAVWRSKNLVAADRRMAGKRWPFALQGVRFEVDGRLFGSAREMYCRHVYFPAPAFDLVPGTTVVDLGANIGMFSVLAALVGCRVIAIEAQGGLIRELVSLASSYGVQSRIIAENALVGSGTGVFADPSNLAAASHFEDSIPPVVALDTLLDRHGVEHVDFMKVDIEGSEFDLLRAPDLWLPRVRRIAMEVHPRFGSPSRLVDLLLANGFAVQLRNNALSPVQLIPAGGGYLFAMREALQTG